MGGVESWPSAHFGRVSVRQGGQKGDCGSPRTDRRHSGGRPRLTWKGGPHRGGARVSIHDLWYKNAVIYCLDVEKYMDADGDGVGDFEGLSRRLDYLAGLGVTCVWLQPFYPSPNRDNGYDVTD